MVSFGSIKAVLISTGVAAVALLLKVSVPVAVDFSVSRAPILWSSLLSWLKPPYLYFITNGIIITIAASSRFYRSTDEEIVSGADKIQTEQISEQAPPRQLVVMAVDRIPDFGFETVPLPPLLDDATGPAAAAPAAVVYAEEEMLSEAAEVTSAAMAEEEEEKEKRVVAESSDLVAEDGEQFVAMASPEIASENLPPAEKPLVSARFAQRKSVKSSPEGGARALRVTKPKRHDTLENTWKMITEGKSMPLTRHFKKCDTWQNHGRETSDVPEFKKSETFRDRTNYYQAAEKRPPVKLKKEPSPSQDELNRRVEAFIKKFNDDMRLQRLESLRQYKEIVGRGI